MYRIKFKDILFHSNKQKISNQKIIIFFYGLGCSASDFSFLFKNIYFKTQLFIAELPGHNNLRFIDKNLFSYSRKIFLFIRRNKIKEITFFAHSLGGIIPIILAKNFLKKSIFIKNFINYEGNLTKHDVETLTKKTVSYNKQDFILEKFDNLVDRCENNDHLYLNDWAKSLKKTSKEAFYELSKECVSISQTDILINFFKGFFKKKIYVQGEYSENKNSEHLSGITCLKIRSSGHFSFFENKLEFRRIFNKLILKRI